MFSQLDEHEIRKYSKQIYDDTNFSSLLLKGKPKEELFYSNIFKKLDINSTLKWVEIILINQKEQISDYIELESKVTNHILLEQYEDVQDLLNSFEDKYGKSYTIHQIRSYIINKLSDSESSKKYISETKSDSFKTLYNFILEFLNNRIDNENTYSLRNSELNLKLEEAFGDEFGFLSFLKYKLLPVEYHSNLCFNTILHYEMNSCVVDLYKSYLYLNSLAVNSEENNNVAFSKSVDFVKSKLKDRKLANYSFSLGNMETAKELINRDDIEYIDLYTKGEYMKTCDLFENNSYMMESFNFFELYTRSLVRSKYYHPSIKSSYLDENIDLIARGEALNSKKVLNNSFSLSCLGWFLDQHIFCYLNNTEANVEIHSFLKSLYFIRSDIFSAFKCNYLSDRDSSCVINILTDFHPKSSSLKLYQMYSAKHDMTKEIEELDIAEERKLKYLALHSFSIGHYDSSLEYFKEMHQSNDPINKIESINGLISCYLKLDQLEEAAQLTCETLIINKTKGVNVSLENVCSAIKLNINKKFSIFFTICLYLYGKYHDDTFNNTLKVAFERYLLGRGVSNFRLIEKVECSLDVNIVYFFLENIFVPNVMKGPLLFRKTDEIENTRVEICQYLLEKQAGNKESLEQELKERSKNLVLKDVKNHIDNNKIYVDIDYIKSKVQNDCRNIYDNYLDIIRKSGKSYDTDIENLINTIKENEEESLKDVHPYLLIRSFHSQNKNLSEHSKLLHTIIRKVRDEFTKGVKGLSGYLSTRIKHGTLEKHLLKSFTESEPGVINFFNLIKPSESDEYKFLWADRFSVDNPIKAEKLDKVIKSFSEDFDKVLFNEVIDDWLQVTQYDLDFMQLKKQNDIPIFNYSITNLTLFEIEKKVTTSTSFEELWDIIIEWLWIVTDHVLSDAQSRFNGELCDKFKKLYSKLNEAIYEIKFDNDNLSKELKTEVARSQQKLLSHVRESSKWFSRHTQDIRKPIEMETIVDIVTTSLGIKVIANIDSSLLIEGKFVNYYIDILYNLLSNSIKYSDLSQENIEINLSCSKCGNSINLSVKNSCSYNYNFERDNLRLKEYENIYESEKTLDKLINQGNTGYFKIQKIIIEDLNKNYKCSMKYIGPCEFRSELEIK